MVVVSADATGNYPAGSLPLYLDENGYKTIQPTANKAYVATDDNSAPLIWYNSNGLDVETGDPLPVPRVGDNGTSAGTALYDLDDNQQATIPVDRLELNVATRPLDVYQSNTADTGVDSLIIDHSGTNSVINGAIDYDAVTDTTTVSGFDPLFKGQGLEAIEVRLGDQADTFDINTTAVTTTLRTNGGDDQVRVKTINGATNIYTGNDNDTINVSNDGRQLQDIDAGLTIYAGDGFDTINANNTGSTSDASSAAEAGAGELSANRLSGLDMGGAINYQQAEELNLDLGSGDDHVTVLSTHSGTTTIVDDAGNDDFYVGDANSPLAGIDGQLTINTGIDNDTLTMENSGATTKQAGFLTDASLTGFGLASTLEFFGVDQITLNLGTNNDDINIESIGVESFINLGAGNDKVHVNYNKSGYQTYLNGIAGELTIDGNTGSDLYEIGLAGAGNALINIDDTGSQTDASDPGVDNIYIYGTDNEDVFLFRPGAISALSVDANGNQVPDQIERVNYDDGINGTVAVYGRESDDTFVFDSTSSKITAFGDAGDDAFQIGQMFKSVRQANAGLAVEDRFDTTATTQGELSDGVNHSTSLYGGIGNDSFTVYHNKDDLWMYGDEDDDIFMVRAFGPINPDDEKAPITNLNGGQGADFISYTLNAPVNIEGGDGYDTLTVIGTEFADKFVVSANGVYGAGLFVQYSGLEKVTVDAMEGNDTFFIDSTNEHVELELIGGMGSDTFNTAGGEVGDNITVVSNDLKGHSGIIDTQIDGMAQSYQELWMKNLIANVWDNEEAGVVIRPIQGGALRVFEDEVHAQAGLIVNTYEVFLTKAPTSDVRITASAVPLSEKDREAGAQSITLSTVNTDGDVNTSESGVNLFFTQQNWFKSQEITIAAIDDDAAEGLRTINIQHSVTQGATDSD
ncbi:hypothetical protein, partial [Neptunomonas sp.]|uniref:hypothetical protein n=1 Tax=Neptunomonas sp. TaxID=1971898 RepID=UPI003561EDE9